ncbi:hypothetical protein ABGB07_42325 [Micromonosporaceae bacterium B7E4]
MRDRGTATLWWIVPLLLAVLFVPLAPAPPAAALAPGETGKYYVVGPPVNGQREYLYSIALRTLGNGNRFREIVQLNRGRKQPDGATFTDGVELAPGWILVLPRDADGPGVRTGPLPTIGPQTPRPSPSTVVPSPSTMVPSPSATTRRPAPSAVTSGPAADPVDTVAGRPPADSEPSAPSRFGPNLVRAGAGVLAVTLAVLALLVLRRRGYRTRSVTLDDGPWPPERHRTPTPAELDALVVATPSTSPPPPEPLPSRVSPAPPPEPDSPVSGPPEPSPEWPPSAGTGPARAPSGPPAAEPSGVVGGGGRMDIPVRPRPALPVDGDVPYVQANVRTEVGAILVRLAGVTTGPATPAYAWLADDEPAPAAAVPLVLGRDGPWRLHVDLGRTPDVFTLVGAVEDCRRLAAAYARQLHAGGIRVAVVGDALGADAFDGCRSLTGLPEPGDESPDPFVVIIAGLPEGAGAGVRGLAAATGGRCVPVVIGPVPDGRWSAQVRAGE